ncbi:MAG TPA: plastocyanin/azurin family copper-binding protein [Chloroflexota bacterium]|nr:plastocyanin/azurin family copper-binding protein [Chloroflexota bacterium]
MSRLRVWIERVVALVALGVLVLPVTASAQSSPIVRPTNQELKDATSGGKDWLTSGGAGNNQRYSTLTQMDTTNVQNLQGAWLTRLGSGNGSKYKFEADPVVIDVAEDAKTGQQLWKFQTGWGISAPPISYAIDGTQYVAVVSGGNRGGVTTLDGDAVWGFSLNGTVGQVPAPRAPDTKVTLGGAQRRIGDTLPGTGTAADTTFDGTIDTAEYSFNPVRVVIPVGTTLTWQNNGAVIHTATDQKGAWNTGDIKGGESASVTFDQPGTYLYTCTPHPSMIGEITVQ